MLDRRQLAALEVADGDFGMRLLSLEMARGLNRHVLAVAMCARRAIDRDLVAGAPCSLSPRSAPIVLQFSANRSAFWILQLQPVR